MGRVGLEERCRGERGLRGNALLQRGPLPRGPLSQMLRRIRVSARRPEQVAASCLAPPAAAAAARARRFQRRDTAHLHQQHVVDGLNKARDRPRASRGVVRLVVSPGATATSHQAILLAARHSVEASEAEIGLSSVTIPPTSCRVPPRLGTRLDLARIAEANALASARGEGIRDFAGAREMAVLTTGCAYAERYVV